MKTFDFYYHTIKKRLPVSSIVLAVVISVHTMAMADGRYNDLSRLLSKGGLIGEIDLAAGKIVVNGIVYHIDMQKTRLIGPDGLPLDYFSLEKNLIIRFGLSDNDKHQNIVSVIQITGPEKRLQMLTSH